MSLVKRKPWNKFFDTFGDYLKKIPNCKHCALLGCYSESCCKKKQIIVGLIRNSHITWQHVVENPELPWPKMLIQSNPNVDYDFIVRNFGHSQFFPNFIIQNLNLTADQVREFIKNNPQDLFDAPLPYFNRNLKIDFWLEEIAKLSSPANREDRLILISRVCRYGNITLDDVLAHPEINWHYSALAENINIYPKDVFAHPELPWAYYNLSFNSNMTWDIIAANLDKKWSWDRLSLVLDVPLDFIVSNPELGWNYMFLSANPFITFEMIRSALHLPWHFDKFLQWNPNAKWEYVMQYPEIPWDIDFDLSPIGRAVFQQPFKFESFLPGTNREIFIQPNHWRPLSVEYFMIGLIATFWINLFLFVAKAVSWYCRWFIFKFVTNREMILNSMILFARNDLKNNFYCQGDGYRFTKYSNQTIRRRYAKQCHDQIYGELLQRACRPSRSVFSWNEGAAEEMPETYAKECRHWREHKL
jgi:hypothetical protein